MQTVTRERRAPETIDRRLRAPFRVAEFRFLLAGEVLSVGGDQLARVALSVMVFSRTHSAALTGLTYALTFAPAFVGGALFGSLGDRFPRRTVMVTADCVRAALMGLASLRGVPTWALCVLVALTTLVNGPFKGAQQALLPAVLPASVYTTGMAVRNIAIQAAQLTAFGLGGVLVAGVSARSALWMDALSFVGSGLLLRIGVRTRPPARSEHVPFLSAARQGAAIVWRDPALRSITALLWLAAFYVVPEALAAPYVAAIGGGAAAVGLLMASDPAGSILGGITLGKWIPDAVGHRIMGVLGIAAGLPLTACVLRPPVPVSMLLFALSGAAATAYTIYGVAEFLRRLPDGMRAQGSGILGAGLVTVQGLGSLGAGALTSAVGPAATISIAGLAGAATAVPIAVAWARARHSAPVWEQAGGSGLAVEHGDSPSLRNSENNDAKSSGESTRNDTE